MKSSTKISSYNTLEEHQININQNYFDFSLNDIELSNLLNLLKTKNLSNETISTVNTKFDFFIEFLESNLNQMSYPYLANSVFPFIEGLEDLASQKYFIILILSRKKEILSIGKTFFTRLVKINQFGITSKMNSIINKEIMESKEYSIFIEKFALWNSYSEVIIIYFEILKKYYNENFIFNKNDYSADQHYKYNLKLFAKKNLYKLSSSLCSNGSIDSKIDFKKIVFLLSSSLSYGFNFSNFLIFPQNQVNRAIGAFALNYVVSKISSLLKYESYFIEFREFAKVVEKGNMKLIKLISRTYDLIKKEMVNDGRESNGEGQEEFKETIVKLGYKIEKFLKDVDINEEEENELKESLEMQEISDNWVMMYVEGNNNE